MCLSAAFSPVVKPVSRSGASLQAAGTYETHDRAVCYPFVNRGRPRFGDPGKKGGPIKNKIRIWKYGKRDIIFAAVLTTSLIKKG